MTGIYSGAELRHWGIYDFIDSQFVRFNIEKPPQSFIEIITYRALSMFDFWDPYGWFYGSSDVKIEPDEFHYTFEMQNYKTGEWEELDPENTEFFRYHPGQDERTFIHLMSNIGIKPIENMCIGAELAIEDDHYYSSEESEWHEMTEEERAYMHTICTRNCSGDFSQNYKTYRELIVWASTTWFFSPMAREFRKEKHPIFTECYEQGECIMFEGFVYSPKEYRKILRPPQSCVVCGLDSYCCELVILGGGTRHVCEFHLNGVGNDVFSCGFRRCKYVECPHHRLHGQDNARRLVMQEYGQMNNNKRTQHLIAGVSDQKLIAG